MTLGSRKKEAGSQCPSNKDNIANLEFKRVIPRELLRQKAGVEFVYNVDLGGFYE
ncbi:hypothetical protein MWH06_03685 [Wolbachia pipientis]|nr:hypothetical protein MWH06_03685 [Wolbachia pipientis]